MTDAFECDRCGDLYGEPPEIRLATNRTEDAGGKVSMTSESRGERFAHNPLVGSSSQSYSGYEINYGDLCEDCAEAFREFWSGSDE